MEQLLKVDPVKYEWCAAFVNFILHNHNLPGSESVSSSPLVARSFLHWGTPVTEPMRGDIIVLARGRKGWQGHVGFYHKTIVRDSVEYYILLGGNQNDMISYEEFPVTSVIGIRRWES